MPSIAFDCDGTLVDSEPLHNRADILVLASLGISIDPDEHRQRSTGIGRPAMLRVIERERGITLPPDTDRRIEAQLRQLVASELKPIPGVPETLLALAQRGAVMAVASNSDAAYLEQALTTCGLRHYFGERIASSDRVARLKPAPDMYLLAAALLGTPAAECIAVEDSKAGVASAHAAGMRTIGYCPPGHVFTPDQMMQAGAREVITSFTDLLALLD
jgi:HAD superfamily hydrolase (TIGR01509 family)|nr:hypothetical protein [uncultured bacterium]